MTQVLPFRGLRYDPSIVGDLARVVCPPYDVISAAEQRALQAQNAFNAIRVELPEDRPGEAGTRYAEAAAALADWQSKGALKRDGRPAYYFHSTTFTSGDQPLERRDIIAAIGAEAWESGAVLPHERTMAGPKADRLELMRATGANVSPVWVLYREEPSAVRDAWRWCDGRGPDAKLTLGDGEAHRIWMVDDPTLVDAIRQAFNDGPGVYIADGHHRYETAYRFRQEAEGHLPGARAALAVVTRADDPGLVVLPTHRILLSVPAGTTVGDLATTWSTHFEVTEVDADGDIARVIERATTGQAGTEDEEDVSFLVLGPGQAGLRRLRVRDLDAARRALPGDRSEAWKGLDLAVLHGLVIDPLVEATGEERESVLRYTRDVAEAVASVQERPESMAFFPRPTRVSQVLDVADAGDRMPEKSTYFYPKPPTGLVIRRLDEL